jgi:O-antigen/teichoic acid export membrane protein
MEPIRNAGITLTSRTIIILSNLILIPIIIGEYGTNGYGEYALLFSAVTIFLSLDLGVSAYLMNNLKSQDKANSNLQVLSNAQKSAFKYFPFISLLFYISLMNTEKTFTGNTTLMDLDYKIKLFSVFSLSALLLFNSVSRYYFAILRNNVANVYICLQSTIGAMGTLVGLWLGFGITSLVGTNFLCQLIFALGYWVNINRIERESDTEQLSIIAAKQFHFKDYYAFQLLQITAQLLLAAPVIILTIMIDTRAAGEFVAQWKYLSTPITISSLLFFHYWKKTQNLAENSSGEDIKNVIKSQLIFNLKVVLILLPTYLLSAGYVVSLLTSGLIKPNLPFILLCGFVNSSYFVFQPLSYAVNGILSQKQLIKLLSINLFSYGILAFIAIKLLGVYGLLLGMLLTSLLMGILSFKEISLEKGSS